MKRIALLSLTALPLSSAPALAADQPLWELGAGVGLLSMPDYRGSDTRLNYALPIPYLVYRGDILQVDRDKVRGLFYQGDGTEWDVSMGASTPVSSNDNSARAGMPKLDPTVEIGPRFSYRLRNDHIKIWLRLPLRKVLAVDFPTISDVGTVFTPTIALDRDDHPAPGWHASVSTGPLFGDREYHQYYYRVRPSEASVNRPAYDPDWGYGGWQFTATLAKRFDNIWVGGFIRADYLGGAAFADSPLVQNRLDWMGGVGISWIFAKSEQRVTWDPIER